MEIGHLQKVSLIDYPGRISAIVFTRGCNFRCPYCHNPELVDPRRYPDCLSEEVVFSFLEKRKDRLEALVITGGEPTLHNDLAEFVERVKNMGYLVKIDTNGSHPEVISKLLDQEHVDYIAMDIKAPLEKYCAVTRTSVDERAIMQSIRLIMSSGIDHEFRTTAAELSEADIMKIGAMIKHAPFYALQRYRSQNHLDKDFVSKTAFTEQEFCALKTKLQNTVARVVIR